MGRASYDAAVYDDAEDQFFQQGYPSQPRPGRPVVSAVVASVITTVVVFFVLRALENAGAISTPGARSAQTAGQLLPAAAAPAPGSAQVPSLVGMQLEQARELLKGRNLLISIKEERNDPTRPAGSVLAQNPLPGSEVQSGTTVELVTARSGANLIVPPVAGQKVEEAIATLAAQGYKLGPQKPAAAGSVAAGLVAGTEPAAGSSVAPGSTISLLVATPAGKPVPKITGVRLNRAKRMLEEAGFKIGRTRYTYDPCCGGNIILEQTPAADQPAAPGSAVDVLLNESD
ncbi:MAG TPA: PASTA domain-containing protein [Polyangia bacterium]